MQLNKKKELAARTLGVGKERIMFNLHRLAEIKEAITKQDIRDLLQANAIFAKQIKGRKTRMKVKKRRGPGSIKKKIKGGKREYISVTRRLRFYIRDLRKKNILNSNDYLRLRKEIKSRMFKDKTHLKEAIKNISNGAK